MADTINTLLTSIIGVKGFQATGYKEFKDFIVVYGENSPEFPDNLCPICNKSCPTHQTHRGKKWRHLEFPSGSMLYIAANHKRVKCPDHGVKTTVVPWALPGSRFTEAFELNVACLALEASKDFVSKYYRIAWPTVGACIERVALMSRDLSARFDNLRYIGIDETSYKKGHKYMTTVLNHETNSVVWVGIGYGSDVLNEFFDKLTDEQKASIQVVTADGARWIDLTLKKHLTNYTRCVDSFHVMEWVQEYLEKCRRKVWRDQRKKLTELESTSDVKRGRPAKDDKQALKLKKVRKELAQIRKSKILLNSDPSELDELGTSRLEEVLSSNKNLRRAYELKELMRKVIKLGRNGKTDEAIELLNSFIWRSTHSKQSDLIKLGHKIMRHRDNIQGTLRTGLTNARVEANNNRIKRVIRNAFGFRNTELMKKSILFHCSNIGKELDELVGKKPSTTSHMRCS